MSGLNCWDFSVSQESVIIVLKPNIDLESWHGCTVGSDPHPTPQLCRGTTHFASYFEKWVSSKVERVDVPIFVHPWRFMNPPFEGHIPISVYGRDKLPKNVIKA